MTYKNKVDEIISTIKNQNKITDLFVVYEMDRKIFQIKDKIESKIIKSFEKFDLIDLKNVLFELSKISLWNSDYEMEFKIVKY